MSRKRFYNLFACLILALSLQFYPISSGYAQYPDINEVDGATYDGYSGRAMSINRLITGIFNSTFTNNSTTGEGGAIYIFKMDGSIENTIFRGNKVTTQSLSAGGGALLLENATGNILNSTFTDNNAFNGGAIGLTSNFAGNIISSSFMDNSATQWGGAIYSKSTFSGNIINSIFTNNRSIRTEVIRGGGAIFTPTFTGNIIGSTFEGNHSGSGGAVYANMFMGNIMDSVFRKNSAVRLGGALNLDGMGATTHNVANEQRYIANTLFENNTAGVLGGAIFSGHMDNITISDSQFLNNTAGGYGGAIFLSTSLDTMPGTNASDPNAVFTSQDITLSASAGKELTFSGNRDSTGANSIYIGNHEATSRINAKITVTGEGRVELYDPLYVDMNAGHNFIFDRTDTSGKGEFIWGGRNVISTQGGTSNINFNSGYTVLLSNYTLVAGADTDMNVTLGSDHTLRFDLPDRDSNLALLDFSQTTSGYVDFEQDTTITTVRSLLSTEGRYLLIDGYDPLNPSDFGNINFVNTTGTTFGLEVENDQVWLVYAHRADKAETYYRPNVRRALRALDQLIRHTDYGLNMSDDQFQVFLDDIDTTPPEAAVTMGVISMQTQNAVRRNALRTAFAPPAGRFQAASAFDGMSSMKETALRTSHLGESMTRYSSARSVKPEQMYAPFQAHAQRSMDWTPAMAETRRSLGLNTEMADPASAYGLQFWMGYIGNFATAQTHSGYMGYDTTSNGILMGLSGEVSDAVSIGGYGAYTNTSSTFDELRSEAKADGVHGGLFARYDTPLGLSLTVDGTASRYGTTVERNTANLSHSETSFNQYVYSVGLEAAYELQPWTRGRLTPFAGIRQTWARQDGFTETGDVLSAQVSSADTKSLISTAGVALAHDFLIGNTAAITPSLELSWQHDFGDRYVITRNNNFTAPLITDEASLLYDTYSLPRDRDLFQAGGAVQSRIVTANGYHIGLKAAYSFDKSENYTGHGVYAGFEFRF